MFAPYARSPSEPPPHFSSLPPYLGGGPPAGTVKRRLLLDNRDRPDPANTSPFDFSVHLTQAGVDRYENVTAVELKGLAFPKVAGEPYVIMDIRELNDQIDATNSAAHRTFGVMYFDSELLTPGQVKAVKGYDFYQRAARFNPPLPSMDRLTIKFLTHSGNVVTTAQTGGETHASMLLEITTGVNRS